MSPIPNPISRTPNPVPTGYSLLEVLVATAILAIGLLAIFGLTQSARQRSLDASDLAAVELVAETTLNELLAKQTLIEPVPPCPIDGARYWKLEVKLYPSTRGDLVTVFLNAQKFSPQDNLPTGISFQLLRWVPKHRVNSGSGVRDSGFGIGGTESEGREGIPEFDDPYL